MKTVKEWSDAFDVLFNEVMSNASASLDEYDKSIFITKGQEEVIKNYFNPKGNKYQEGFDCKQKRQIDFSSIMKTDTQTAPTNGSFPASLFDGRSNSVSIAIRKTLLSTFSSRYQNLANKEVPLSLRSPEHVHTRFVKTSPSVHSPLATSTIYLP